MTRCRIAAGLLLLILPAIAPAATADRQWVEARSDAFQVVSDAGEKRAVEVVRQLERFRALFAEHLKARVDAGRPVVVFAVAQESGLRELLPSLWQDRRQARPAGAFITTRDKYLVALTLGRDSFHTVYHEYAHVLARLNARWLPVWLDEGLAEFYGATEIEGDDVRWGDVPFDHMRRLREAKPLTLAQLFAVDRTSRMYNEAGRATIFYAQSAVLTHLLMLGDTARRGQVERYLRLLEEGQDDAQAQRQAFGDLRMLEQELNEYLKRREYRRFKVTLPGPALDVRTRRVSPAEADAMRGEFLARSGRPREARPLLEAAVAREPGLALAHEGLGILEAGRGRPAAALRHFREASRLSPAAYAGWLRAGITRDPDAVPVVDLARREEDLRRAVAARPALAASLAGLGQVIVEQRERYDEAIALIERAQALEPSDVGHRVTLWYALRVAGREDDVRRVESELMRLAQVDASLLTSMAVRLETDGNPAGSEALVQRAREVHPRNQSILLVVARTLDRQKRPEDAEAVLREALALTPDSPRLLNTLAYSLAKSGRKLEEALQLVNRALAQEPHNGSYIDTKGWVLFRMNRLDEAEKALREAIGIRESAVQFDQLADVLLARGKTDQALVTYERALDAPDASEELRASVREKLERLRAGRS